MVFSFPALNACLNAASAVLLSAGYVFIRRGNVAAHRACMGAAFAVSAAFLASYLYYHAHAGHVRFPGTGWFRSVYFFILITHTVLAAAVPPMALATLFKALKGDYAAHKRWARATAPLWMYVSATGVAIYWMLYR